MEFYSIFYKTLRNVVLFAACLIEISSQVTFLQQFKVCINLPDILYIRIMYVLILLSTGPSRHNLLDLTVLG